MEVPSLSHESRLFKYLLLLIYFWLCQVLLAPRRIFSCGFLTLSCSHVGSSSLTQDQTWAPALGARSLSPWATKDVPVSPLFLSSNPRAPSSSLSSWAPWWHLILDDLGSRLSSDQGGPLWSQREFVPLETDRSTGREMRHSSGEGGCACLALLPSGPFPPDCSRLAWLHQAPLGSLQETLRSETTLNLGICNSHLTWTLKVIQALVDFKEGLKKNKEGLSSGGRMGAPNSRLRSLAVQREWNLQGAAGKQQKRGLASWGAAAMTPDQGDSWLCLSLIGAFRSPNNPK